MILTSTSTTSKTLKTIVRLKRIFSIPLLAEKIAPGSPPARLPKPLPRLCNTTQTTVATETIISTMSKNFSINSS